MLSQQDLDTAVLLTTELVANAMLHTDSEEVEVHIAIAQGALRIGVSDEELASPEPSAPASEDTSGRGLQIVNHLSETWGVDYTEKGGKCVWFSIPAAPPGAPSGY